MVIKFLANERAMSNAEHLARDLLARQYRLRYAGGDEKAKQIVEGKNPSMPATAPIAALCEVLAVKHGMIWRPIEEWPPASYTQSKKPGQEYAFYFPAIPGDSPGRVGHGKMIRIETSHPGTPRKPTHFAEIHGPEGI